MTRMLLILLLLCAGCGYRHHYTRVRAHVCCHLYGSAAVDVEHYAYRGEYAHE